MLSSSLFLRSSTTLIAFFAYLSVALAATKATSANYTLVKNYFGSTFFTSFDFFTDPDPTHGFVTYVNQSQAQSMGLLSAANGSPVRIGVDYTNKYNGSAPYSGINGVGRPSVRITSKQVYNHGLFIADIANMPGGVCGTWPALWTLGTGQWPYSGEIDVIEGVHTQTQALSSLHSAGRCNVPSYPSTETGTIQTTNCTYDPVTGNNAAGCGVLGGDTSSFGSPFNSMGGGVFAWEWTSSTIRTWFFRRNAIPSDITNGAPQPSGWGLPYVNFQGDCSIDSNFKNHQIVLDTTFCGDWAGAVWSDSCAASTGVSSCSVYVGNNPSAFKNMYWSINSIKVYSNETTATTTTTTTTTTVSQTTSSVVTTTTTAKSLTSTTSSIVSTTTSATSSSISPSTSTSSVSSTITSSSRTTTSPSASTATSTTPSSSTLAPSSSSSSSSVSSSRLTTTTTSASLSSSSISSISQTIPSTTVTPSSTAPSTTPSPTPPSSSSISPSTSPSTTPVPTTTSSVTTSASSIASTPSSSLSPSTTTSISTTLSSSTTRRSVIRITTTAAVTTTTTTITTSSDTPGVTARSDGAGADALAHLHRHRLRNRHHRDVW